MSFESIFLSTLHNIGYFVRGIITQKIIFQHPTQKKGFRLKLTAQMEDSVACIDVRQESVAKSLTFARSFHQSSNVDDVEKCGYFAVDKNKRDVRCDVS